MMYESSRVSRFFALAGCIGIILFSSSCSVNLNSKAFDPSSESDTPLPDFNSDGSLPPLQFSEATLFRTAEGLFGGTPQVGSILYFDQTYVTYLLTSPDDEFRLVRSKRDGTETLVLDKFIDFYSHNFDSRENLNEALSVNQSGREFDFVNLINGKQRTFEVDSFADSRSLTYHYVKDGIIILATKTILGKEVEFKKFFVDRETLEVTDYNVDLEGYSISQILHTYPNENKLKALAIDDETNFYVFVTFNFNGEILATSHIRPEIEGKSHLFATSDGVTRAQRASSFAIVSEFECMPGEDARVQRHNSLFENLKTQNNLPRSKFFFSCTFSDQVTFFVFDAISETFRNIQNFSKTNVNIRTVHSDPSGRALMVNLLDSSSVYETWLIDTARGSAKLVASKTQGLTNGFRSKNDGFEVFYSTKEEYTYFGEKLFVYDSTTGEARKFEPFGAEAESLYGTALLVGEEEILVSGSSSFGHNGIYSYKLDSKTLRYVNSFDQLQPEWRSIYKTDFGWFFQTPSGVGSKLSKFDPNSLQSIVFDSTDTHHHIVGESENRNLVFDGFLENESGGFSSLYSANVENLVLSKVAENVKFGGSFLVDGLSSIFFLRNKENLEMELHSFDFQTQESSFITDFDRNTLGRIQGSTYVRFRKSNAYYLLDLNTNTIYPSNTAYRHRNGNYFWSVHSDKLYKFHIETQTQTVTTLNGYYYSSYVPTVGDRVLVRTSSPSPYSAMILDLSTEQIEGEKLLEYSSASFYKANKNGTKLMAEVRNQIHFINIESGTSVHLDENKEMGYSSNNFQFNESENVFYFQGYGHDTRQMLLYRADIAESSITEVVPYQEGRFGVSDYELDPDSGKLFVIADWDKSNQFSLYTVYDGQVKRTIEPKDDFEDVIGIEMLEGPEKSLIVFTKNSLTGITEVKSLTIE